MKFWKWLTTFLRENSIVVILVFTAWLKLLGVDAIMYDDAKGPSIIFFIAFTAASALLIHSPVFAFKDKFRDRVAMSISILLSLVIWADMVYFRYFGSLIKIETLAIIGQTTGVGDSVLALLSPLDILFFVDIILISVFLLHRKMNPVNQKPLKERLLTAFIIFLISSLPISAILWRDRADALDNFIFHNYDINIIEFRYGLIGAHSLNTFRSILTALESLDKAEEEAAIGWISANTIGQQENQFTNLAQGKNVFVIQIESLQDFVIGRKFEGLEITPNLNKLVAGSYYLPNGHAVIGGGQTSDSDFAANTSVYPLKDASVFVQYGKDEFTSLPKALKNNGYTAEAYHAYRRDFWNRGTAFNSLGYDHFFAGEEYDIDEKIIMGLSDESFYRQTLDKLPSEDGPTFNFMISLSSHHPFIMAKDYQTLGGDESKHDFKTFHYLQSVHYADYALGIFLDGLKERGLYDDSLLVVYGDHLAKIGDLGDTGVIRMIESFDFSEMDKIPFIYKLPNQKVGKTLNHQSSQLDIMPTVLNLAGVKTNYPMFGGDALTGEGRGISKEEAMYYSDLMIRFNLFKYFKN
jgi:phosphoglycerol transferase MdoB-like AlkP superfamily enzyme